MIPMESLPIDVDGHFLLLFVGSTKAHVRQGCQLDRHWLAMTEAGFVGQPRRRAQLVAAAVLVVFSVSVLPLHKKLLFYDGKYNQ